MKRKNLAVLIIALVALLAVTALVGCSGQTGGGTGGGSGGSGTGGYGTSPGTGGTGGTNPGTGGTGGTSPNTVTERNIAFDPAKLSVKVGDTVTFVNEDSAPHNVEIDGKELGQQAQGDKVEWKAEKAGSFPYLCTIHPSMTGEITVE